MKIDFHLIKRYKEDYEFRTILTSLFSSCASAAVGGYHLFFALIAAGNTTWLITLSAYYFVLAGGRIFVLLSHRVGFKRGERYPLKQRRGALNYLSGGLLLIFLDITFLGIVFLVTIKDFHYTYEGNMIYFMSFYAFFKVISALVKVFRYKKYNDLTVQTFRNINLADGVVSLVALQSALLYIFSPDERIFSERMNAFVGGAAGVFLLLLGFVMLIKGLRALKKLPQES